MRAVRLAFFFVLICGVSVVDAAEDPSALVDRGLALAQAHKMDEARRVFLQGRKLFPHDKRFPLELAGIAQRNKDSASAKRYLLEALKLDPKDSYGNEFLANLYLLEDNLPGALRYWNRVNKPLIQTFNLDPAPHLDPVLRERALEISPGQLFTLARLEATESNLNRLDVFRAYQFDLVPRQDQRFDLTFRSFPISQPLSGWLGQLLPLVRGLPYQTIYFDRYNIGGRALNITSLGRWDHNKRRLAFDMAAPLRLNPRLRYRFLVDARDENWDLSTTYRGLNGGLARLVLQKLESGGEVQFVLTPKLNWTTGLHFAVRRFRDGDGSPTFANSWSFEERNRFDYALWRWPERRVRIDTSALLRTGRVVTGAPSRLIIASGDLKAEWLPRPKNDKLRLSARLRSGGAFGTIPFDELFQLGVERDNDLWLRGHAGTRDGRKGSAPLGTRYALTQLEADRSVFERPFFRLQAGPFYDGGWISDSDGQFGSKRWLHDIGVQGKVTTIGNLKWSFSYGRDLRGGRGVFYTSVSR